MEAVDGELGTPDARWQRPRLLPVLHAIQARIGFISPGAVNYVAERLDVAPAEIHGVASFYGMFSLTPRAPVVAHVCDDIVCLTHGAATLCDELSKSSITWRRSPCLGLCERAPAALITAAGEKLNEFAVAPETTAAIQSAVGQAILPAAGFRAGSARDRQESQPQAKVPAPPQAGQPQ